MHQIRSVPNFRETSGELKVRYGKPQDINGCKKGESRILVISRRSTIRRNVQKRSIISQPSANPSCRTVSTNDAQRRKRDDTTWGCSILIYGYLAVSQRGIVFQHQRR